MNTKYYPCFLIIPIIGERCFDNNIRLSNSVREEYPGPQNEGKKMNAKNMTKVFATFAFCIVTTVFANDAFAAGFGIKIDCHGDDGYPTWAQSSGPITIKAKVNNVWFNLTTSLVVSNNDCDGEDRVFVSYPAFSWEEVQQTTISNGGNDMLFMDRVFLTTEGGSIKRSSGVDNNIGYCLSAETEDPSPYCWNGRSYRSLTWTW